MMDIILNWLDFLWIPVVLLTLRKGQKLRAVIFILACMLALRLEVDLMLQGDMPNGFIGFWDIPVLYKGYIVYGVFIGLFLILSHLANQKDLFIYMGAAITVFFIASITSIGVMFL